MLRSKPLPPIHLVLSTEPTTYKDLEAGLPRQIGVRRAGIARRQPGDVEAPPGPMNHRPVLRTSPRRVGPLRPTGRPEDGVAALCASLSTRYPPRQAGARTDDPVKRARTRYLTNATPADRRTPKDVPMADGGQDAHHHNRRHSNRRPKDAAAAATRAGGLWSFPPGRVIKRSDDNLGVPQMFPKVARADRGGPCPTQLYAKTKFSSTARINGSVQLEHRARKGARPRMEPLRVPPTPPDGTGTGSALPRAGEASQSLGSVISSSKMKLEGRVPDAVTAERDHTLRALSPLLKQYLDCDDELAAPPNSEIGPSRMQVLTP